MRQAGHPAAGIQLSGPAAQDARDPQIMMGALVVARAAAMAVFASRAVGPVNGVVQLAAVTLALAAEALAVAPGTGPPVTTAASLAIGPPRPGKTALVSTVRHRACSVWSARSGLPMVPCWA